MKIEQVIKKLNKNGKNKYSLYQKWADGSYCNLFTPDTLEKAPCHKHSHNGAICGACACACGAIPRSIDSVKL